MSSHYFAPQGGLPPQTELLSSRAIFTPAFAVIPRRVMTDIVVSHFPGWDGTRGWVLARPMTGFAETFAQIIMEVLPEGGAEIPEPDTRAQGAFFVLEGRITVTIDGEGHGLGPGGFAYLPPGLDYTLRNNGPDTARFHWIRKIYQPAPGLDAPDPVFIHEQDVVPVRMDDKGVWSTTRFVDPRDMRHDMHINIVNFAPGGAISFSETHVMEHGLYILEGKGVYRLNDVWVEVQEGDFMWLRAFCPQACYAGGPGMFRYLLYKDVNRHPSLTLP